MASLTDLLVMTSAGGIQCSYLIPHLYGKYNLRLVVRSESSRDRLKMQYPDADVVQADITQPAQCEQILKNATRVYHVGPSLTPYESEIGMHMIDAAVHEHQRSGSFKHFFYSSVLNTQFRKMFNHDRKRYVEEYLFESGLNYTVTNPGDILNLALPVQNLVQMPEPGYRSIMGLESKSAFVVLEDYAEACANIIAQGSKHYQAQYQMCSMPPIAYGQVARDFGEALGKKDFPVSLMPYEEAVQMLHKFIGNATGIDSPRTLDGVERLILFYRRRGLEGNPNCMEWILGRKPTSHKEWIAKRLQEVGHQS